MDTLELIQTLPAELREQIGKEYVKIKLWQRKMQGWDEVNEAILNAPYCIKNQQITRVLHCYKCDLKCGRNYLCSLCHTRKRQRHCLGPDMFDPDEYDPCFEKGITINSRVRGYKH